jgi:hypothetical protein
MKVLAWKRINDWTQVDVATSMEVNQVVVQCSSRRIQPPKDADYGCRSAAFSNRLSPVGRLLWMVSSSSADISGSAFGALPDAEVRRAAPREGDRRGADVAEAVDTRRRLAEGGAAVVVLEEGAGRFADVAAARASSLVRNACMTSACDGCWL